MLPSRIAAIVLLALLPAAPLRAQAPAAAPPDSARALPPHAAPAPRDTTRFLPPWLRPWLELGGGWMSAPAYLKRSYESGQGFAAGLEARPSRHWALRAGLDYQMLIANNSIGIVVDPFGDPGYADTLRFETQTTGWILSERTEVGVRLPHDFWLTAGAGGGYMHSGLLDLFGGSVTGADSTSILRRQAIESSAVASGWGWMWTAALRYDFTPGPRVPLGLDVRTSALERGHDTVRTWSVRLCYRVPEPLPHGAAPLHHRR